MNAFSPLNLNVIVASIVWLLASYLLGALAINNRLVGLSNVALRVGIGLVFGLSILAVSQAGFNTELMPFLVFFILLSAENIRSNRKLVFVDIKHLGLLDWGMLLVLYVGFFLVEAYRLNLVEGGDVFVGNPDTAFYSGFGHSMFNTGMETIPEHHPEDSSKMLYHFADLWFSGAVSSLFDVLPYYANGLVFRVLCMGTVAVSVFGVLNKTLNNRVVSLFVSVGSLYIVTFPGLFLGEDALMLFRGFPLDYPLACKSSHLIVAVLAVPVLVDQLENGLQFRTSLLFFWLPFLNMGMVLTSVFAVSTWSVYTVFVLKKRTKTDVNSLLLSWLVAVTPVVYCLFTERIGGGGTIGLTLDFFYIFIHTVFRALISQILLTPFWIGVYVFWKRSNTQIRESIVFQTCLYVGAILGFSFVFPQVQGNSDQLLSLSAQTGFVFIGLFGLALHSTSAGLAKKVLGIIVLSGTLLFTLVEFINTNGYAKNYDWSNWSVIEDRSYQKWASIPLIDAQQIQHLFESLGESKIGYFVCNNSAEERPHYSAFVHLKAFVPGLRLYRLNPLATDTLKSEEMSGYLKRTAVGFELTKQTAFNKVAQEVYREVKPNVLLVPKTWNYPMSINVKNDTPMNYNQPNYCIVDSLINQYRLRLETSQYKFYVLGY